MAPCFQAREDTNKWGKCILRWESERQFFVPLGYDQKLGFGMNQVLSQNKQSTSQAFAGFGLIYLPTNPFFPQARLTGLFGLAPFPALFSLLLLRCLLFLAPIWQSGTTVGEGKSVNPIGRAMLKFPGRQRCSFLAGKQTGSCFPFY